MIALTDLWLPILVSAVVVFVASALAWMVLPHHKPDIKFLQNEQEQAFASTLKEQNIAPGVYMFPGCDHESIKTDEGKARFQAGPWGVLMLQSSAPNFGRNLGLVFVFYLVVSLFVAYLTSFASIAGTNFMDTFRVASTAAIACYCLAGIPHAIFFGRPMRTVIVEIIDGLVYGLLTGTIFALLWPVASAPVVPGIPT